METVTQRQRDQKLVEQALTGMDELTTTLDDTINGCLYNDEFTFQYELVEDVSALVTALAYFRSSMLRTAAKYGVPVSAKFLEATEKDGG